MLIYGSRETINQFHRIAVRPDLPNTSTPLGKERSILQMASKENAKDIDEGHPDFDPIKPSSFPTQPKLIYNLDFFSKTPGKTRSSITRTRIMLPNKEIEKEFEKPVIDMETATKAFAAAIERVEKDGEIQESKDDAIDRQSGLHYFGMAHLGETMKQYEESLEYINAVHYDKMSKLWESTKKGKMIGFRRDPNEISETDFDLAIEYFQKWNEYVNLAVCTAQLHNAEKRFGAFQDESRCIKLKADAVAGEKTEISPTLRQQFNDPTGFMESKYFERDQEDLLGKSHIPEVLTERTSICTDLVKRMKYLNSTMMETEVKLPYLPPELPDDESRPFKAPHNVDQALSDLNFSRDDIRSSSQEILTLQDSARYVMMTWAATSDAAWRYGKKHIQQFPVLREYDNKRASLLGQYLAVERSERKLLDYFQSKSYKKGTYPELELALRVDRTTADFEQEWKGRQQEIKSAYKTVPQLVKQVQGLVGELRQYWEQAEEDGGAVLKFSNK